MTLPRLTGPRVRLEPVPHALAVAVLAGEPGPALEVAGLRAAVGWPHAGTTDALRPLAEHGAEGDDGGWLVVLDGPDGAEVVGECGWQGGPSVTGDVTLDYGLAASQRGRGLGTEAVAVLCAWVEAQPGVRRLVAEVQVGNEPSRRLLRRLGFAEVADVPPWLRCVRPVSGVHGQAVRGRHVC